MARLTIRILHDRIRSAVLGRHFDPNSLGLIRTHRSLSGGAGASTPMRVGQSTAGFLRAPLSPEVRAEFAAQSTPGATYHRYLDWRR